ncbi:type II toxin-antitoxin system RelE/ParE family toxin [Phenylobacterium sp.]|uniref:type II toxin-antitoxin system RelE/ParE family toxin n=1 Tax=Phenylobacterium sp. TaxID=1871053 RepID=UPI0037CC70F8
MKLRLTAQADEDLDAVFLQGAERFGLAQADAYVEALLRTLDLIADFPRAASERQEFDPPVRIYPYRSHVIVFRIESEEVVVVRIRHGREDWMRSPHG